MKGLTKHDQKTKQRNCCMSLIVLLLPMGPRLLRGFGSPLRITSTVTLPVICPSRQCYLCPPLSSFKDSFHTSPKATLTSRPSSTVWPSGGASLACVPGSNVEKIDPKSCKKHPPTCIVLVVLLVPDFFEGNCTVQMFLKKKLYIDIAYKSICVHLVLRTCIHLHGFLYAPYI